MSLSFLYFQGLEFRPQRACLEAMAENLKHKADLFSRILFPFRPLTGHPSSFSPQKMLAAVSKGHSTGAVPGCTSPQILGGNFLPEICVKIGQERFSFGFLLLSLGQVLSSFSSEKELSNPKLVPASSQQDS